MCFRGRQILSQTSCFPVSSLSAKLSYSKWRYSQQLVRQTSEWYQILICLSAKWTSALMFFYIYSTIYYKINVYSWANQLRVGEVLSSSETYTSFRWIPGSCVWQRQESKQWWIVEEGREVVNKEGREKGRLATKAQRGRGLRKVSD